MSGAVVVVGPHGPILVETGSPRDAPPAVGDVDAVVTLDRIRRLAATVDEETGNPVRNTETVAEPYVWTALIAGDQDSLDSGVVAVVAPTPVEGAREARRLRVGETTDMPDAQRSFVHRFGTDFQWGFIAFVAVVLEEDELPWDAVRAGYQKFVELLESEVGKAVREMGLDIDLDELQEKIEPKVKDAIKDAMPLFFERLEVLFGFRNPDDIIGFASHRDLVLQPGQATEFTLDVEKRRTIREVVSSPSGAPPITRDVDLVDHYQIDGRFETREGTPPDPCEPLRAVVDFLRGQLHAAERDGASDDAIAHLSAELSAAQQDLTRCEQSGRR